MTGKIFTAALFLVAAVATITSITTAYAQEGTDLGALMEYETAYKVIGIGFLGGLVVAYQGYRKTRSKWDTLKFFDGLLTSVLGSIPLAIGFAMTQTTMGPFELFAAFMASIGTGYTILKARKPTVPSNASTDEDAPDKEQDDAGAATTGDGGSGAEPGKENQPTERGK